MLEAILGCLTLECPAGYVVRRAAIDSINGWSTFTPIAEVGLCPIVCVRAPSLQ